MLRSAANDSSPHAQPASRIPPTKSAPRIFLSKARPSWLYLPVGAGVFLAGVLAGYFIPHPDGSVTQASAPPVIAANPPIPAFAHAASTTAGDSAEIALPTPQLALMDDNNTGGEPEILEQNAMELAAQSLQNPTSSAPALPLPATNAEAAMWAATAQQLTRDGSYAQAEHYLERALQKEPDNLAYALKLAALYDRAGDRERAVHAYRDLLRHAKAAPDPRLPLAMIRERMNYLETFEEADEDASP